MEKGTRPPVNRCSLKGQEELQTIGLNYSASTCLLWEKGNGVSLAGNSSHYSDNKCSPGLNWGPRFLFSLEQLHGLQSALNDEVVGIARLL